MSAPKNSLLSNAGHCLMVVLTLPIFAYALIYLVPDAPGQAAVILANDWADLALPTHAGAGAIALIIGPFQFFHRLRFQRPRLHRVLGMAYVCACSVSACSGFVLATGSASGSVVGLGFGLAATVWFGCTAMGLKTALSRCFADHRHWMVRSFAMTFSAVTLRVQLGIGVASGLSFTEIYPLLAFTCWIPNLIFAEIWLRWTQAQNQPALRSAG